MQLDKTKIRFEAPPQALAKWDSEIRAAKDDADGVTINMYSTIGEYGDGSGMTAKIVNGILRKADGADVVVNINSPGGDFFEGIAINTILKEYKGDVHVRVVGLAASAASVVAMAGDEIEIAKSGFFMIHNAWTIALGNKNDMQDVADMLTKFDKSMSGLYAARTGIDEKRVAKMMDHETWLQGGEAVNMGFASSLLGDDAIKVEEAQDKEYNAALRKVDLELAKAGMPRSERRSLIKELIGTPGAAKDPTPCAGLNEALNGLLKTIKTN